ncbi:phenylalanine--tRNA ligase subunit beta [Candidatus Roizmanbacteria bacterium]|nr:phenylalanine--tRNA ligase subunit beta [Candidatus Roizmanbacteria bacterium]
MNIKITYNWLLEYLDTDVSPYDLQKYLSLCGPSVESLEKVEDDYIFDIEVTSNRVDMASVFGIAQEAQAILPRFGRKAKLKQNPPSDLRFENLNIKDGARQLKIQIRNSKLCLRFTALTLSNVTVGKSPDLVSKRLKLCGVKSINNVIDISNYLMIALGQPTHIFDYDKIKDHAMILRESKKGEEITTLDGTKITLPGADIVIEDGSGRLIDLCGIMGGLNSAVTNKTKNIVLFVQTYDKQKIRKTAMTTGQRTLAATYFEKGLDEERVEPTLVYGVELLKKHANAVISSPLYDIYPVPYKEKTVSISMSEVNRIIGVKIVKNEVVKILNSLGFLHKERRSKTQLAFTVPSWRKDDISMKEDLVEEIARIYGYHNLPNVLPPMAYARRWKEQDESIAMQQKIKYLLKHLGLCEVVNYSMISKDDIVGLSLSEKNHLKLSNSISEDLLYMRTTLVPSFIKNIKENQGKKESLRFFEIAKVYYPKVDSLPTEVYKLGIATNTSFSDLKGILEVLLSELNIKNSEIRQGNVPFLLPHVQAKAVSNGDNLGFFGQLTSKIQEKHGLKKPVFLAELEFQSLVDNYKVVAPYETISPYAVIKLDLTAKIENYEEFRKSAFAKSKFLKQIEVVDVFGNKVTVRLYFTSPKRNLTEKEAQEELSKIKERIKG